MANLEQAVKWAEQKIKCHICRYADNFSDMIVTKDSEGREVIVHRECLEDNGPIQHRRPLE